jgi:hypothetical protein
MEKQVSRFQERAALLLGAGTLLGLILGKRRPQWGGIMLFGMGGLLLRAGIDWLRSREPIEDAPVQYQPPFDIVTEDSEESVPASDPPAWALGVR